MDVGIALRYSLGVPLRVLIWVLALLALAATDARAITVAHWTFNGTLDDVSTEDATNDAITLGPGATMENGLLKLDVAGEVATFLRSAELTFTNSTSFTIWARIRNTSSALKNQDILHNAGAGVGGFMFRVDQNTKLRASWPYLGGGDFQSNLVSDVLNQWYDVAFVFSASGNEVLYRRTLGVTSSETGSLTNDGVGLTTYTIDLTVGEMDELRIFNTALSVAELDALSAEANPVPEPATVLLVGLGGATFFRSRRRSRRAA